MKFCQGGGLLLLPVLILLLGGAASAFTTTRRGAFIFGGVGRRALQGRRRCTSGWGEDGALGIIICDHGSKRAAANDMIHTVRERFVARDGGGGAIVKVAHMELAEPSIQQAFDECVKAGATTIVCHPFFLSPGRHVTEDIPALMQEAAAHHPHVRWTISAPLGMAPSMPDLMHSVVQSALERGDFQSTASHQEEAAPPR